jgi:putative transposase
VYYVAAPLDPAELAVMRRLDRLHLEYPFMGARLLRDTLNRERDGGGAAYPQIGRKAVTTLMRRMGISALYQKPGTSTKHPGHAIYPYLLRGVKVARSNQVWALDTTYGTPSQRSPPEWGPSCLSMSGMHRSSELILQ